MSECVTGYIDHIIFRNEDNGYTVMVLKGVKDEDDSIPYTANSFRQCG